MDNESMLLFTKRPDLVLLRIHRLPPVRTEYEDVREHCAIQLFAILVGRNYRAIHNPDIAIQTHVEFVEFGVPIFRLRMSDHPIDMLLLIQEKVDRNDMNEIRSQNTV
jgi:hypothetical protein